MKSKAAIASLLAIMMIVMVMPMTIGEDTDALTGNSNISLNAQHVNLYTDSPTRNSFVFTVDLTGNTSDSTTVNWTTRSIGQPQASVQLSATTGNSITVTGNGAGSIEIVATVDESNYASAVVAVQTGYAPATEFNFFIKIDSSANGYLSTLSCPSNVTTEQLNNGIWLTVTEDDFESMGWEGTFNALNAFLCAIEMQNIEIRTSGLTDYVLWDCSVSSYGWFESFLGLGTYQGTNGDWIYWAQYHGVQNDAGQWAWAFNNYVFGDIETEDYSYIGMIFWPSPPTMAVPTPFPTIP